jgi:hypothetical protein
VPKVCIDVAKPEDRVQATLAEKQRAETINILRAAGLPILKKQQYLDFDLEEPELDKATGLPKNEAECLPTAAPSATTDTGEPGGGVPTSAPPATK